MFPEKAASNWQIAIGPAKADIGFLGGISRRSKEVTSVEEFSRESTRINTN
jgi:hypothetical protein